MLPYATTEEVEPALDLAKTNLDDFEARTQRSELVARLRRSNPMHPTLVVRGLAMLATLGSGAVAIGCLAAPLASRDLAVSLSRLDSALGVPLPAVLGLLFVLGLTTTAAAHLAAMAAARSTPLLPHEAKAHQRLVSEVKQLEAKKAVKKRMTPPPARPRLRAG